MDGSSTNGSAFGSISTNNGDTDQNALDMNDSCDIGHLSLEEGVSVNQGLEREDRESDGQRRMLSMDDDGGSFFEASAMQNLETVVRKGGNNVADVNNMHNQVVSDYQEFLNSEGDGVLFDPAKRLNFDDTTEDEEDEQKDEMIVAGIRGEEVERRENDNSGSEDGSSGSNYLDHRPRVNGSDSVEDGAVAAAVTSTSRTSLNLVSEQGQNVRIIEGHDSSLQDDDDGNTTSLSGVGGSAFRFNGNFMQTQVVNLPSLPSGRSRDESDDDDENEDGQNLYDSLDPEDGTSPYRGHTMVEHQVLDPSTSEYYSGGSLLSLQTLTSQQSHVDRDGESFWPQQEMGELSHLRSSVASNTANLLSFQQESFSSSHHDPPAHVPNVGNLNFQSSGISEQISVKDSAVGSGGGCGDFGSSLISSESTTHQNIMSDSQDGFELCDEGLLHGPQLYAQPMTSPKANQSFEGESDNSTMSLQRKIVHQPNSKKHVEGGDGILSASAPNPNKSNHIHFTESRANMDAESSVQSNDNNSISGSNNSSVGVIRDERQAAAGSSGAPWSNQNQSAKPKVPRSTSVPRKRITATTKAQQTRRPAVQGSASREGNSKVTTSSNTSATVLVASNNGLTGNSAIATSSSGTSKSGKIPSHTMHSSTTVNNSTRATAQGGDSPMMASGFVKNDGKNKSNDDNKCVTSDGGCRVSGSGAVNIDMMNPSSKFSRSYQPHSSSRPSSSYASMSSLTTATNNRVSGVGKESHYNQRRGPAQISLGPVHSQSRTDQSNRALEMGNSGCTESYSNTKQQGKAVRTQSVLSNHSLSGQENVKPMAKNVNNMQITSSHVPQVSSDQDLQLSVNSDSRSSSHSSSLHDIMMSTSQTLQQQQLQQHKSQQQQRQQHHSQHHCRQEFPIQQQQNQVSAQPSSLNPFLLSPQSPLSPSGSDHSHHSYNREAVITQMDTLQHRQPTRHPHNAELLTSINQSEGAVLGMEEVRSHLNSMLNVAADRSISGHDQTETATELLSFDQPVQRQLQFDLDSSSALNGTSGPDDMSEILENFPTFSSKMFTEMSGKGMHPSSNKSDTQAHGENHYLRDNLEKERYRRKHCEQQIQKLNAKLLETQQQLAVAVSTDKRKDLMIEQLDKQLARVVEGWKKREADKDVLVSSLTGEKEHAEECLHRQQTMINNFEHDLAQTVAELKEEKEKSSETIEKLKSELMESNQMREEVEENLASAADKCSKMAEEWDTLTKAKVTAERLAQQAQDTLVEEESKWKLKESDLLSKITQVKEANEKVINMEKVKLEEEKKKREDLESECGELRTELKKIVLDAEQLVREKESQKVEMSIMEAKFESAQRKLEADLHAQVEKEIAEQATEYHSKLETAMEELSEKHRKQVGELHTCHQQDMEQQMAKANDEMDRKDSEHRRKIDEMEERLAENRNEISNLKQSKLKLESQRMEILSKLQFMMQSQWNEAVSLLVSTPQKRGLSSSFLSNQSMSMSGMLSNAQPNSQPLGDNSNMTNGYGISNGSNDSSLTSSLNLASLVMSASAPPLPSSSALSPTAVTPSQQSASITSTTVTTASTVVMSFSPPGGGEKVEDCSEGSGDKVLMENKKTVPLFDSCKGISDHSSSSTSSSSNNNSMPLGGLVSQEPDAMTNKGIHSVKETDKGRSEGAEQISTRDKVEEYVFRTAAQSTNKPIVSSRHRDLSAYSASPKSPITCTAASDPGRDNSIVSAVVHHPSIPTSGFRAMAIQSPRQRSSSRFWNDLGVDPTSLEQGSHAPPPSAVTSYSSMHHDDHIHGTALVHNNQMLQQQRKQQQHQQQQQQQQQYQQELHRHHHHLSPQLHLSQPNPHPHPNQQQHNHHRQQQQQQFNQQRQQQQQRQQNEVQTSGQAWPPSFLTGNPSSRDLHKHTTKAGDMSPPVRQPAMRREDLEDSIVSEGSGVTDPIRLQADYNHLTDQVDAHENRQEELQHYIQMLLKKAPGTVEWERGNESFEILESSRDLTVDLDLTETGQALEMTNQMGRLQELRERQQGIANRHGYDLSGQLHMAPGIAPSNNGLNASFLSEMGLGGGGSGQVLSPQNLVEISQLLSMYREQWETSPESATNSNTAGQLMDVLALRRSHGVSANLTSIPDKVYGAANTSSVSTGSGSGGKNSSRGHHNKKSKAYSSSLSSSTSSGTTKDAFIRNRKKIGYQSADSNLNSSSDSGHHHHGGGGPKQGTSSTGRKGQGAGKGAPPSSKPIKASGHSAWK